jgi:hypothetical protein
MGGFNAAVVLSASGLARGMKATFAPGSFSAPGNGSSALTITVGLLVLPGKYTIQITGSGGGKTHVQILNITVTAPVVGS